MPYHLHDVHLRVVRHYLKDARGEAIANARMLILEHVLPTTEEFLREIRDAGGEIFAFLGKPYSVDPAIEKSLRDQGFPLEIRQYDELENTTYLDELLQRAIAKSRRDGRLILIIDVGGYFAEPLARLPLEDAPYIAGVVEDTTFGHNRYANIVTSIKVPVVSVARSALKEIEARFVGRDAVAAMDQIFRAQGITLAGRRALVIGYGMIGSNIAYALRRYDVVTTVYDVQHYKMLQAFTDGFYVHTLRQLQRNADIIFSATAAQALSYDQIEECKSHVVLVSAGSKDTEFDVAGLRRQARKREAIGDYLEGFDLTNSKRIVLANQGTAVNFILRSLPEEILDLVFAEILVACLTLLQQGAEQENYPPANLNESSEDVLSSISKEWLRLINPA